MKREFSGAGPAARMCPVCGEDCGVYRSRELSDGTVSRKRRCSRCGTVFETQEKFSRVLYMARQDG